MKSIIYEFDPVIYPYPVLITKQFKAGELAELFYVLDTANNLNEADAEDFLPNGSVIARTLFVVSKKSHMRYVIILMVRPKEIMEGCISHESMHATNMIAESLGFLPQKSTEDEPCAYLSQWIANCMASVKKGYTDTMKGKRYD